MTTSELRALLERAGVGYLFDDQPERMAAAIRGDIAAVEREYRARYGTTLDLLARCESDEAGMAAFLQALAAPISTGMRVMALRMIEGATLVSVDYTYRERDRSRLVAVIRAADGALEEFVSDEVWDYEVLRHFGVMKVGEQPVLDGYFAFRPRSK